MSSKSINRQSQKTKFSLPLPIAIALMAIFILVANSFALNASKVLAIICCAASVLLLVCAGKRKSIMSTPLVYAVCGYVLWAGLSTLYGKARSFAIFEYSYLLPGFAAFLAVLLYMKRTENGFRTLATLIAWGSVPVGVLSIDAASSNILMPALRAATGWFTTIYTESGLGFHNRLDTIWGNANVYAGLMSIATLLSLYLLLTSATRKQRIADSILLLLNAVGYLLAFSMGSLFFFSLACVLYLICAGKGNRLPLFVIMLETAIVALLISFISMLGLQAEASGSLIPLLALVAGCVVLTVVDLFLRDRICAILDRHRKTAVITLVAIVLLAGVFLLFALRVSGAITLSPGGTLMRSAKLPTGSYTLSVDASEPFDITIRSRTDRNVLSNTSTVLVSDNTANQPITFNVAEGTKAVFFDLSVAEDAAAPVTIHSISYRGEKDGSLPLRYTFLPSFIANRYQELAASGTAGIRTTFFRDGLKLFLRSPITGRGLGGFENGIQLEQKFYYETKYAHNHYVQALCDLGIVGFLLFIGFIVFSVLLLWRGRNRYLSVAAVLAACCMQMFGQGMSDIVWSSCVPLLIYLMLLGACAALFGDLLCIPQAQRGNRLASNIACWTSCGLCAVFCILISIHCHFQFAFYDRSLDTLDKLSSAASLDIFGRNDYVTSYVVSVAEADDEAIAQQAQSYLSILERQESNSIPRHLATEYYAVREDFTGTRSMFDKMLSYSPASPENWQAIFAFYEDKLDLYTRESENNPGASQNLNGSADLLADAYYFYEKLQEYNADQWYPVELETANLMFLNRLIAIHDVTDVMGRINTMTTLYFDTASAPDADANGRPDFAADNIQISWGDRTATALSDTTLSLDYTYKSSSDAFLTISTSTPDAITSVVMEGEELQLTPVANGLQAQIPLAADLLTGSEPHTLELALQEGAEISGIRCSKQS